MSMLFTLHNRLAGRTLLTAAALALASVAPSSATTLAFQGVVMSNLANPRGMVVGPDGALYVAEAGSGGDGASITSGDGSEVYLGMSSAITRWLDGMQERVISGLPSLAQSDGSGATGAHDVAFSSDGVLYTILGFGADPNLRSGLPSEAALMGQIVSVSGGIASAFADLANYESVNNPDGSPVPDSNPFSLVALPGGGFIASDAGGNDILSISADKEISTLAVLPAKANPLPFGPPAFQPVPTGIALDADGNVLIGQLTGFPFPVGGASVFSLSGSTLSGFATGFTNLIDVAYGADGIVYALEHDSDSILGPLTTGSLYSIAADGTSSLLFSGLENPTGLALGENGRIYIAVNGLSGTGGSVIALAPVPLPAALPVMLLLLVGLIGLARIRHHQS